MTEEVTDGVGQTGREEDEAGRTGRDEDEAGERRGSYPAVWSEEMWRDKQAASPWTDSKDVKLGCKTCTEVAGLF